MEESMEEINGNHNAIYQALDPSLDCLLFDVDADVTTTMAMKDVLDRTPHKVQLEVWHHLGRMAHDQHPLQPSSVTMIMPTGYGKSCVRDTHAFVEGRFTLTIVPLLSLGIDQAEKMKPFSNLQTGVINSIHVDHYKSKRSKAQLVSQLKLVRPNMKQTFLLFASPQSIVDSPAMQELIASLIERKLL